MKVKYLLILVSLCFQLLSNSMAQSGLVHLDKPYYFNGEYVFYAVYLENPQTDSSLILLRMAKEGELIEEHFQTQIKGHFSGYFKLRHQLPSGTYDIEAFAFEHKTGQALALFNTSFSVLGEDTPSENPQQYVSTNPLRSARQDPDIQLLISEENSQREGRVSATLQNISTGAKSLSIGLRKFTPNGELIPNFRSFQHELNQRACMTGLPVLGYKVGLDSSKAGDTTQSQSSLLYAFQPKSLQFQLATVDQKGEFALGFPLLYGKNVLQFLDFFLSTPVDVNHASIPHPEKPDPIKVEDSSLVEEYVRYQKRKQIYQLFNQLPHQVLAHETEKPVAPQEPDFEVDVQDYNIKGRLADLFAEFISPLNFQKKEGKYQIKVFYKIKGQPAFHKYPTLFIVNGVATQDVNFINSLTLQEVERVKIYSELRTLQSVVGSYNIGGLVVIDLIDHLFKLPQALALPSMEITGLQAPISYPITLDTTDVEIPRIQSLVYWTSDKQLKSDEAYHFQFNNPDLSGKYRMDVVIQDAKGQIHVKSFHLYKQKQGWRILQD